MKKLFYVAVSLFIIALLALPAFATTAYRIVLLDSLGTGWNEARAINNQNQIAGVSGDRAALWDALGVHSLGSGSAFDINEKGQVAGSQGNRACYWDERGTAHILTTLPERLDSARTINNNGVCAGFTEEYPHEYGCIWNQGTWQQLPEYGSFSSIHDINDSGIGCGFSDGTQPLRWTGTSWEALPSLGGYNSMGGINESGVIVGQSNGSAVLWNSTGIHIIGKIPGYARSYASSINNHNVVVGGTVYSGSYGRGWVWDGSAMQVLDPLQGYQFSDANGINDNGWIVGMCGNYGGDVRAVAWIPVPEPSSTLALLSGLGGLGLVIRRRIKA